jgi:hypothetical protein
MASRAAEVMPPHLDYEGDEFLPTRATGDGNDVSQIHGTPH